MKREIVRIRQKDGTVWEIGKPWNQVPNWEERRLEAFPLLVGAIFYDGDENVYDVLGLPSDPEAEWAKAKVGVVATIAGDAVEVTETRWPLDHMMAYNQSREMMTDVEQLALVVRAKLDVADLKKDLIDLEAGRLPARDEPAPGAEPGGGVS